jgi:NitT/TauT family transport system substrate-binding protein
MLGLLAAAATVRPRAVAAQASRTVRIGIEASDTFGEPMFGLDAGIFGRAGLTVTLTILPAAGAIAAAVAGGALDAGLTDAIVLANAFNRGVALTALAASGLFRSGDPTSGLCVLKTAPQRTAKSFEGQAIAVGTLVSLTSISLRMWLAHNGADVASVRFVEMPFGDMPAALGRRTVAGAYFAEPLLTQNAADITLIAIPYSAIADSFPISLVVAGRAWLAQNPDLGRRLAGAIYETARWANQNRDRTAPILAKYSQLELELIRRMRRTPFATSLEPAMLQPILDAAAAYKLIDRPTSAADLIARL